MTNAELTALLNERVGLTGVEAVTPNVIRQWVAWDVLPTATAKGRSIGQGPAWSRSGSAMRRALRLAEIRKLGVKRETAVIVQAYIEWGHTDFELVRRALLLELKKWRSQLTRRRTTHIGAADYRSLSAVQQRAIRSQLGPLDDRFAGTQFQQSDEFYATFVELAESGRGDAEHLKGLLAGTFERTLPGIGQLFPDLPIDGFAASIAGTLGLPEEIDNSAQFEIESASEREFRIGRAIMRRMLRMRRQAGKVLESKSIAEEFRELLALPIVLDPQISVGPWAVFQMVQCILSARRGHQFPEMVVNTDNYANLLEALFPGFATIKA